MGREGFTEQRRPLWVPLSLRRCGKEHGGNKTYCEFIIPIWLALAQAQASLLVIDQLYMSLSASVACLIL